MSTAIPARVHGAGAWGERSQLVLVPWMVAGVRSQYEQMRGAPAVDEAHVLPVHPYREGGLIERLPLPSSMRGTLRSTATASRAIGKRRMGAVWTQVALPMLPFALTRRVPVFYAIDCTPRQLHAFGEHYRGVDDPASPQGRLTAALLSMFFRRCAGLLPWSGWVARSMIADYGAREQAVHVVPPGIDLEQWHPIERDAPARPRLLFVGADFERKGGPMLLDVYREHFRDEAELHLVTKRPLEPEPGVHVHNDLGVGDARLRSLYQESDVLVLPTLADCFSMAALEAMACGLPVVISRVGGIPEIVIEGETGLLLSPGKPDSLLRALRVILSSAALRRRLGRAGRARVELHFDARAQTSTTLAIMAQAMAR